MIVALTPSLTVIYEILKIIAWCLEIKSHNKLNSVNPKEWIENYIVSECVCLFEISLINIKFKFIWSLTSLSTLYRSYHDW